MEVTWKPNQYVVRAHNVKTKKGMRKISSYLKNYPKPSKDLRIVVSPLPAEEQIIKCPHCDNIWNRNTGIYINRRTGIIWHKEFIVTGKKNYYEGMRTIYQDTVLKCLNCNNKFILRDY